METSARLFKLCIFVVLSLCYWKWLVPLVWVIIICTLYYVRGVVWWVATSLRTNHTQHLLIFYLSNWRTRLFADNSIAASDFINGFFSCGFSLSWLFGGCLRIFWARWIRGGELYNNTYKQRNDGRALGLSHITPHMSMRRQMAS